MFRPLARLQSFGTRSRFDHCLTALSRASNSAIDENAIRRRRVSSNQWPSDSRSVKRTAYDRLAGRSNDGRVSPVRSKSRPENAVESNASSNNVNVDSFLNSIAPRVTELSCDELEAVHKKIFDLYNQPMSRAGPKHYREVRSLLESPIYEQLLEATRKKLRQFQPSALVTVFQSIVSFYYDQKQARLVKETMQALNDQLKELDLKLLFTCLNSANYNMRDLKLLRGSKNVVNIFEFSQKVLKETKRRILDDAFDGNDTEMIAKNFQIFLRPLQFDSEVIVRLTELLCRPQTELDFRQSIVLLGKIKKCYLMYTQLHEKVASSDLMQNDEFVIGRNEQARRWLATEYLPKQLAGLIEKCNRNIYASFQSKPDPRDQFFYLNVLHDVVNPINYEFDNFYDPKILHDFLAPFLLEHNPNDRRSNLLFSNLMFNYYMFHRCDERLLRLLYDSILRQPTEWQKLDGVAHLYFVFTKFRLPFVDANRLSECILNPSNLGFQRAMSVKVTSIALLCDLVLNNVTNERLYDYLDRKIEKLKGNFRVYASMKKRLFAKLTLARVYLSVFDDLKDGVKQKVSTRIDTVLANVKVANKRPTVNNVFLRINNTLQANGYLSNGLYMDTLAIYDKSTEELVPLSGHDFNQIDEIPLTSDQELLTIILTEHLEGQKQRFENSYCLRLAEILGRLNIKVIKVEEKAIQKLDLKDRVDFYIRKALDSYKSASARREAP